MMGSNCLNLDPGLDPGFKKYSLRPHNGIEYIPL
jgi:hypothetical protein